MKVLYLISGVGPPAGWGTEYIQDLIFELSKKNIQPTIINPIYKHTNKDLCKWISEVKKEYGITVISIESPNFIKNNFKLHLLLTPFFVTFAVIKLLQKENFDLVHEFSSTPFILLRAFILKTFFKLPTIFTLSVYNNTFLGDFMWFKVFNFAKYYLIPSKELLEKISSLGIQKEKLVYSPPGIYLEKFTKLLPEKVARKKLNLPPDKKIVTFFGSLTKEKGLEEILKVINFFEKNNLDKLRKVLFCFFVIWKGSDEHKFYKKTILDINSDYVQIREELVNIPLILSASNIILLPQRTGFGTTIPPISTVEALAAQKKVIATSIIGNRDLRQNRNLVLIPPKNPEELYKAINNNLERSENGFKTDLNDYKMENSLTLHLSLYKTF